MLAKLLNWLSPPADVDTEQMTRMLRAVIRLTIVATAVLALQNLYQGYLLPALVFFVTGLLYATLLGLLHLGFRQLPAWLLPILTLLGLTVVLLEGAGIDSVHILAYPVVIVLAALFLGKRVAVIFTLLSVLSMTLVIYATRQGIMQVESRATDYSILLILVPNLAVMALALYLLADTLTRNLHQVRDSEQALRESNRQLDAMRASLEEQVVERTRDADEARRQAEAAQEAMARQMWLTAGEADLGDVLQGEQTPAELAEKLITFLCEYTGARAGALFLRRENSLHLAAAYAYTNHEKLQTDFSLGEGLVGQAALEKQPLILNNPDGNRLRIISGLGQAVPRQLLVLPLLAEEQVTGVIELATLDLFSATQIEFLQDVSENVAIAFNTAHARVRINELLAETQQQAEELQAQDEELRVANEEMEAQTTSLRASETRLQQQQQQLEATNAQLEEKASALQESTRILREKQAVLDQQNQELRQAQQELEQKADELAQSNRYKSEFLANMSHELRTPLNSLLILARMLANNEEGNLSPEQVESAEIIHGGGQDLLRLINEILDLSKIEAGKMSFHLEPVSLRNLADAMRLQFQHVAEAKGLSLEIQLARELPPTIESDQQRLAQILTNLLGNAFKFTEAGVVTLSIFRPQRDVVLEEQTLPRENAIAFRVRDTGVGMTPEQQQVVFEGFQQADGSTSRKYGGTGLGLTISKELARHLGGTIVLSSRWQEGSTFTVYLPLARSTAAARPEKPAEPLPPAQLESRETGESSRVPDSLPQPLPPGDDRNRLSPHSQTLLIIEDDAHFSRILYDYAQRKSFNCLVATEGRAALSLARSYRPDAIILDLNLPDMSGWEVLERLKENADTRHIPVHIISAKAPDFRAYHMGALSFLSKPLTTGDLDTVFQKIESFLAREIKSLLLVEDDQGVQQSVQKLLGGDDIQIHTAASGQQALAALHSHHIDCIILDLRLPDMSGFEFLNRMRNDAAIFRCPIIVYTGQTLTQEESEELLQYADSIIVKGARSSERLLDETALFLHRVVSEMPPEKQNSIKQLHDRETQLVGKHILIVDDDLRNAFALSKLLGDKGLQVTIARNGLKALELLDGDERFDLVLMDIMMPEMDGYETMRTIRAQEQFRLLPILALTAKAMQGDAEKCIAAGANDYLSKPVDIERLFSMLRVWLYSQNRISDGVELGETA